MCFIFSFGLFLCVVPALQDNVTIWVGASRPVTTGVFLVVLAEAESLQMSLALSSVLPCPMLWLHIHLHGPCSRSEVVLGTLH